MAEPRQCAGCSKLITPGPRERNKRKWCSGACRLAYYRRTDPEFRDRDRRSSRESARRSKLRTRLEQGSPISYGECTECGSAFVIPGRRPKLTCSNRCKWRRSRRLIDREADVARRRSANQRYRARRRDAHVEEFSDIEIFERDRWVCGLCGRRVKRSISYPHPDSASLDHIVPLSLGGQHTRANVQLAHFGCNSAKRERAAGEQLRLIG